MLTAIVHCWRQGVLVHGPLLGWGHMREADFEEMSWSDCPPFLMPKHPPGP